MAKNIMGADAGERKRDYEISERIRSNFYTEEGKKKNLRANFSFLNFLQIEVI